MASPKRILVPESGSDAELKRFLLQPGWRRCTGCGIRRRGKHRRLELCILADKVQWFCGVCRRNLTVSWAEEVERSLQHIHHVYAEEIMVQALERLAV